jgi:hypothetical protein
MIKAGEIVVSSTVSTQVAGGTNLIKVLFAAWPFSKDLSGQLVKIKIANSP